MSQTVEQLETKKQESQAQIEKMMQQLESLQEEMKQTASKANASAVDREKADVLAKDLEKQREMQREQNMKEVTALRETLEKTQKEYEEAVAEKDALALEVEQLTAALEKARHNAEARQSELQNLSERNAEIERIEKKTRGIEEAAKNQLQAFRALRDKARDGLMAQFRQALAQLTKGDGSGVIGTEAADPKAERLALLEEQMEKLRAEIKELSLENKRLKGEAAKFRTTADSRLSRLKHLEEHMASKEQEMERRLQQSYKDSS